MSKGVNYDTPRTLLPPEVWTYAQNMVHREGCLTRINGMTAEGSIVAPTFTDVRKFYSESQWTTTSPYTSGQILCGAVSGGAAKIVEVRSGGTTADVTTATWAGADGLYWTMGAFGPNYIYVNNSGQDPSYQNVVAGGICIPFFGWGPSGSGSDRAVVVRAFGDHMIAMNITAGAGAGGVWVAGRNYPTCVAWSDAGSVLAFPAAWVPAVTNLAGRVHLTGTGGPIYDGAQLRDSFYIYRANSVWRLDRVSDYQVFTATPVFQGWGIIGPNAVASDGNLAYVFTGKELIAHDGQRSQPLLGGKVRKHLADSYPANMAAVTFRTRAYFDPTRSEVVIAYPSGANSWPSAALVYNTQTSEVTLRELPLVRDVGFYQSTGDLDSSGGVLAFPDSQLDWYLGDTGSDFPGSVSISAIAVKADVDLGLPAQRKLVKWVRPVIHGNASAVTMTVTVGGRDTLGVTTSYATGVSYSSATDDKANTFFEGRFLTFKFETTGGVPYNLAGFDVGYEVSGGY